MLLFCLLLHLTCGFSLIFQIKRIKDDVEYYIDANQEPDFEENEYIYDDIIGLDEIELSGVGLPSSATTDSNNSNDTAGSPISMTSGTSPIISPSVGGCVNHNHSSDCHENDCHEKRKKEDVPILSKITVSISIEIFTCSNKIIDTDFIKIQQIFSFVLVLIFNLRLMIVMILFTILACQANCCSSKLKFKYKCEWYSPKLKC